MVEPPARRDRTATATRAGGPPRRREPDLWTAIPLALLLAAQIATVAACIWLVRNHCVLSRGQLLGGFALLCVIDGGVLLAFRAVVQRMVASSPQVIPDARRVAAERAQRATVALASPDVPLQASPSWLPRVRRAA